MNKNNNIVKSLFFFALGFLSSILMLKLTLNSLIIKEKSRAEIITSEPYTIVYHQQYDDKILKACQKDENCMDIMLLEDLITRDEYQEFISQID